MSPAAVNSFSKTLVTPVVASHLRRSITVSLGPTVPVTVSVIKMFNPVANPTKIDVKLFVALSDVNGKFAITAP